MRRLQVYVAAPWVRKEEAIMAGLKFESYGFYITSRWFGHEGDPKDPTGLHDITPERLKEQALGDLADVTRSDVLVVLNLEKSEGKAVETGAALILGKPVISVGPRSNIFQSLGTEVADLDEALDVLMKMATDPALQRTAQNVT